MKLFCYFLSLFERKIPFCPKVPITFIILNLDIHSSHLLPTLGPSPQNRVSINGDAHTRFKREAFGSPFSGETERGERSRKEFFRVELLRQINAIDHMRCFPKVLCGLSVDTDKSYGINKSNFVKSYLELMRNIKP